MVRAKQQVRELLEMLPDECSLEDIQWHVSARRRVLRGLQGVEEAKLVSEEEAEDRML